MILAVEKKLCKLCNEVKTCILVGKFDDRNKKYTDESGSYWNGRVCPVCNKVRVRDNMRKKREADKQAIVSIEGVSNQDGNKPDCA